MKKKLFLLTIVFATCFNASLFSANDTKTFKIKSFKAEKIEIEADVELTTLVTEMNDTYKKLNLEYSIVSGEGEIKKYDNLDILEIKGPSDVKIQVIATAKKNLCDTAYLICKAMTDTSLDFYTNKEEWEKLRGKKFLGAAFDFVEAKSELSNVLIIGNSISIGYTPFVREILTDVSNVYRVPNNAGSTKFGLENIKFWLGNIDWDVIHVNFGLHDLKYTITQKNQDVPPAKYEENLRKLLQYLLDNTNAKIVWAMTSFVPSEVSPRRDMGDDKLYNDIAYKVLKDFPEIIIDDQYTLTKNNPDNQTPHNVHFSPAGYKQQADQAVTKIKEALDL
ncbi:MAG: SGNH/GDSL hydrolase family protein [Rikenellaceae bacterium]